MIEQARDFFFKDKRVMVELNKDILTKEMGLYQFHSIPLFLWFRCQMGPWVWFEVGFSVGDNLQLDIGVVIQK